MSIEGWENEEWINLVQSYDAPEEKQKCLYQSLSEKEIYTRIFWRDFGEWIPHPEEGV